MGSQTSQTSQEPLAATTDTHVSAQDHNFFVEQEGKGWEEEEGGGLLEDGEIEWKRKEEEVGQVAGGGCREEEEEKLRIKELEEMMREEERRREEEAGGGMGGWWEEGGRREWPCGVEDERGRREGGGFEEKRKVSFFWKDEGKVVFLTGTFTNWRNHVPMMKRGGEFMVDLELKPGIYHYKYIVDGEWKYSTKDKYEIDNHGNINNVLLVAWSAPSPSHPHKVFNYFTLYLIILRKDSINESNGVDLDYIKGSYNPEENANEKSKLNINERMGERTWNVTEEWNINESESNFGEGWGQDEEKRREKEGRRRLLEEEDEEETKKELKSMIDEFDVEAHPLPDYLKEPLFLVEAEMEKKKTHNIKDLREDDPYIISIILENKNYIEGPHHVTM